MVERNRIGLTFSYDEEWIAGTYYVLNIIHALKLLPAEDQPEIVIISEAKKNFDIVKKETKYPHLDFFQFPATPPRYTVVDRIVNKIFLSLTKKKPINKSPRILEVDFVYPFHIGDYPVVPKKQVNWVPDFQEVHLPDLFSIEELAGRKHRLENIVTKGDWVVFSSRDSQKDFNDLFPNVRVKQFVLPFAVTHPDIESEDLNRLKEKFDLPDKYYFAPNQFWAHKNHIIILKAISSLKDKGVSVIVAFSGKENDHRNIEYTTRLKKYIDDHGLEGNIRFLGFLPRTEQLKLMQGAVAIIQPSKFEGWSTVVEDAKALGQFLILSNIEVHLEQIKEGAVFFDPDDEQQLADLILHYWNMKKESLKIDYTEQRIGFARRFLNLIDNVNQA